MPTDAQLKGLYRLSYRLTYLMFQPIHLVCIDDRTYNLDISSAGDKGAMPCAPTKAFGQRIINFWRCLLYILAGNTEDIEIQITPDGEVF